MPAKKAKQKKTRPTTVSAKERRHLRQAIRELPSLLAQEMPASAGRLKVNDAEIRRKKMVVALGVGLLMSIVLGLWAVNMRTLFYDVTRAPQTEDSLLANVQADFSAALEEARQRDAALRPPPAQSPESPKMAEESITEALRVSLPLLAAIQTASSTTGTEHTKVESRK